MSKAKELLLECKIKLGVKTDYKLAQALKTSTARISDYMSGKRNPDAYACMQIGLVLHRDPLLILAEIEAETEKNETRKLFWKDFLLQVRQATRRGLPMLLICIAFLFPARPAAADDGLTSHNVYYVKSRISKIFRKSAIWSEVKLDIALLLHS